MTKKCPGCGSVLQSSDPLKAGYIPREKKDSGICVRCYKIQHYNKADLNAVPRDNESIIDIVNGNKIPVLFMLDILNINDESIDTFNKIKGDKILIISKSDIIPKSIRKNTITSWLKSYYDIKDEIVFLSTKKNVNTKIFEKLVDYKKVYLLGYTNVGKSTLVNKFIDDYSTRKLKMTTSMIPNTTLDFNEITVDGFTLIDSPGFTYRNTFYKNEEVDLIKRMDSKKFISPITHQVKPITYLNIEDRFIINSNINNSMTLYMSNFLEIKKIYNVENCDFKCEKIKIHDNCDLVIKGIGFINIKKSCELLVYTDLVDLIEVRESMFYE